MIPTFLTAHINSKVLLKGPKDKVGNLKRHLFQSRVEYVIREGLRYGNYPRITREDLPSLDL